MAVDRAIPSPHPSPPASSVRVYVSGAAAVQAASVALRAAWPGCDIQTSGAGAGLHVVDVRSNRAAAEAARVLATPMTEVVVYGDDGRVVSTRRFVGGLADPSRLRNTVRAAGATEPCDPSSGNGGGGDQHD